MWDAAYADYTAGQYDLAVLGFADGTELEHVAQHGVPRASRRYGGLAQEVATALAEGQGHAVLSVDRAVDLARECEQVAAEYPDFLI